MERPLLVNKPYVEIGGVKWATMNIGANSETDYGLYFQWGDTTGYTASQVGSSSTAYKKPFDIYDCVLHNGSANDNATDFTKYNGNDGLTELEPMNDAAVANWGGNWRMPTADEFYALGEAVNASWVTNYNSSGVNGLLCVDKTDSSKTLFFPAAGSCFNGSAYTSGTDGSCYSSTKYNYNSAYCLYFMSGFIDFGNTSSRCGGCTIRPVLDE